MKIWKLGCIAWTVLVTAGVLLAAPEVRADTPVTLVPSGGAALVSYAGEPGVLATDPATFWYARPSCTGAGIPGDGTSPALILRGSTWGATPREILRVNPTRPGNTCNPYRLVSNIAADANAIYFVDNQGPAGHFSLQRRSRDANPTAPSQLLSDFGSSLTDAEVNAEYPTFLFVIVRRPGAGDVIIQVSKTTGEIVNFDVESAPANSLRDLRFDGKYLYWINGSTLRSDDTTNGAKKNVALGVTSYFPYGFFPGQCSPGGCDPDVAFVIYGHGNQILLTDTVNGDGYPPQYTSTNANATIQYITRTNSDVLYFVERRQAVIGGLDREDRIFRHTGGPTPTLLYGPINNGGPGLDGLTNDLTSLYFHDRVAQTLLKLPLGAAGIPVYDLRAGPIEVTQGIQGPANDVDLYSGRRTFVRFFPKSFGPTDAPNVTASLLVSGFDGVFLGRLDPVNRIGKLLTVSRNPSRVRLDDGFLFEIPLAWTQETTLQFTATVNPFGGAVEDVYTDNSASTPAFILSESPRMDLEIIDFRYLYRGNLVTGGFFENYDSLDYMNRVYPLALGGGAPGDPRPGLHRSINIVQDDGMATRVDRTDPDCRSLLVLNADKTVKQDDRNMCAGNFALAKIQAMRAAGDLPKNRYYYGAIAFDPTLVPNSANCPDSKGQPAQCITRGFNPDKETIAVGPRLDFSGTQQNYMAHEIAHALGRGHPWNSANPICSGQNPSDFSFPNPLGRIGNALLDSVNAFADMGFDPGQDGNALQPRQLRLATQTSDIMTYCTPYWISRHNYVGIRDRLSLFPLSAALRAAGAPLAASLPGDWLLAFGHFSVESDGGAFTSVRRLDAVAEVPPLVDGGYALDLLDAGGQLLAHHAFTPTVTDESAPGLRGFGLVVPFAPETRTLRLVDTGSGKVIATHAVSASRPTVTDVALVAPPDPVTGEVDVTWNAGDADGDALRYDVLYTNDAGASWKPIRLSHDSTTLRVDFGTLAGGTGMLRVEANDGAQSGSALSQPFTVVENPPVPRIAAPVGEIQVQWGQLVTFEGDAEDPQRMPIADASFVWSNPFRTLGTGRALSVTDLEVGEYDVTLTVTNAAGLAATTAVPVRVGDRVSYPGPRLSALPSSITFSVDALAESVQSTTLEVSNVGGPGALPFTAVASSSWILVEGVSALDSNAPITLTVNADAAGLPAGQASVGEIVLTNASTPDDSLTIPVTLVKGSAFLGIVPPDTDGDGVVDTLDDCTLVPNADQTDGDGDGFGNACDADYNNDGMVNFADLGRMKQRFFQVDPVVDLTGDQLVNFADLARIKQMFFRPPGPSGLAP